MTYAASTDVPVERSRTQIEKTLERYGATSFMYGWNVDEAQIAFVITERHIRMRLPMPAKEDREFSVTPTGKRRTASASQGAYEQARKQRWRALLLVIQAKLEAVEVGISTFEQEFLAHVVLPDGSTVGELMLPQIERAYSNGQQPRGILER